MADNKPARDFPRCQRRKPTTDGVQRRCGKPGAACWVVGEFGRQDIVLCSLCKQQLIANGWKVHYQIEGDNPPAQQQGV